jgi:hypothetical protein
MVKQPISFIGRVCFLGFIFGRAESEVSWFEVFGLGVADSWLGPEHQD